MWVGGYIVGPDRAADEKPCQQRMEGRRDAVPAVLDLGPAAEHASESLTRGMRVIAQGRPKQRSYETSEGEKRTVVELDVEEVGQSLRYATAKISGSSDLRV